MCNNARTQFIFSYFLSLVFSSVQKVRVSETHWVFWKTSGLRDVQSVSGS